jgi:hypothetical protein
MGSDFWEGVIYLKVYSREGLFHAEVYFTKRAERSREEVHAKNAKEQSDTKSDNKISL